MGMSVAEYELQKTTGRFRILDTSDARTLSVPGVDCHDDDGQSLLVEFIDDKPVRIVGWDGGSPEDQCLTRDWRWVAVELASVRAQVEPTEAERAVATLDELYTRYLNVLARNKFDAGKAWGQAFDEHHAKTSERLHRAKEKAEL